MRSRASLDASLVRLAGTSALLHRALEDHGAALAGFEGQLKAVQTGASTHLEAGAYPDSVPLLLQPAEHNLDRRPASKEARLRRLQRLSESVGIISAAVQQPIHLWQTDHQSSGADAITNHCPAGHYAVLPRKGSQAVATGEDTLYLAALKPMAIATHLHRFQRF